MTKPESQPTSRSIPPSIPPSIPQSTAKPAAKPMISDDMRKALIAAASFDNMEGPRGRALAVIRTGIDRYAKYDGRRHVIFACGRYIPVCEAVNFANAILKNAGLLDHRIDYPGAKYQSAFINGANDNHVLAGADLRGGA